MSLESNRNQSSLGGDFITPKMIIELPNYALDQDHKLGHFPK